MGGADIRVASGTGGAAEALAEGGTGGTADTRALGGGGGETALTTGGFAMPAASTPGGLGGGGAGFGMNETGAGASGSGSRALGSSASKMPRVDNFRALFGARDVPPEAGESPAVPNGFAVAEPARTGVFAPAGGTPSSVDLKLVCGLIGAAGALAAGPDFGAAGATAADFIVPLGGAAAGRTATSLDGSEGLGAAVGGLAGAVAGFVGAAFAVVASGFAKGCAPGVDAAGFGEGAGAACGFAAGVAPAGGLEDSRSPHPSSRSSLAGVSLGSSGMASAGRLSTAKTRQKHA